MAYFAERRTESTTAPVVHCKSHAAMLFSIYEFFLLFFLGGGGGGWGVYSVSR